MILSPVLAVSFVTPYVGVWIETYNYRDGYKEKGVTPYVGVWIETVHDWTVVRVLMVTPYVGVWIETWCGVGWHCRRKGHSLCGSVD